MGSLVGLAVVGYKKFSGMSIKSVPVAVGLLVMLNVAAGKEVSVVSGNSTEERQLWNEELDRETGDPAWLNSWLFNISPFIL